MPGSCFYIRLSYCTRVHQLEDGFLVGCVFLGYEFVGGVDLGDGLEELGLGVGQGVAGV